MLKFLVKVLEEVFSCPATAVDYAPNFKEVGGAYCFSVVRLSVRSSRFLMHSITLEP